MVDTWSLMWREGEGEGRGEPLTVWWRFEDKMLLITAYRIVSCSLHLPITEKVLCTCYLHHCCY